MGSTYLKATTRDAIRAPQWASHKTDRMAEITLVIPTTDDEYRGLADMKAAAFAEKGAVSDHGKIYRRMASKYPDKLQHCRIAKRGDAIVGAIQLQLGDDPGDLEFPEMLKHELKTNEAYVEFIATDPTCTGQGIGSKLLGWADSFAQEKGCKCLTLEVMKKNEGAVRLYERKGFVIQRNVDPCDRFFTGCFVFFCLGCQYWTVYKMKKPLA
jgi:ribosomal protein S18 acetylase RimI-like enzyme